VLPRGAGRDATSRRTGEEAVAHQEGLGDLLHGLALLPHGDRERGDADRAAAEAAAQGVEHRPVEPVETQRVHLVEVERTMGDVTCINYRVSNDMNGETRAQAVVKGDEVLRSTTRSTKFQKAWNEHCAAKG